MGLSSGSRYIKLLLACGCLGLNGCDSPPEPLTIISAQTSIEFDALMHSRIGANFGQPVAIESGFSASEYVIADGRMVTDFPLTGSTIQDTQDLLGKGVRYSMTGVSASSLEKRVELTRYDDFPGMITFRVEYKNNSAAPVAITKWVNNAHTIPLQTGTDTFWSYQGASYEDRRDWVLPLTVGFEQENYFGMNADDYGSGTPVSDIWRPDLGVAIGHLETVPKLISLPVRFATPEQGATESVAYDYAYNLEPGQTLATFETFVYVHKGDYYASLKNYRKVMARKGLKIEDAPDSSYEPIWCAWGYERNFKVSEILNTLPTVKKLGLKWAVLDDGWQTSEGDWYLNPDKFPKGSEDMQGLVSKIKEQGLKAKLWWTPLAVDPGTDLLRDHEDMLLLDEKGSPVKISWWDSYYLCPAYDKTVEYSKNLVKKFMGEWGFEGLKIDGQHLNGVPRCYNPEHHHQRPEESVERLQDFWGELYKTALEIDKDAVIEICPCGTSYAFFNLPYMNQSVSSDPESSWQVRLKGKTLKALSGESAPYYGDHVELSDNRDDFASSVGIGAVIGTKFTLPSSNPAGKELILTPEKEALWSKWINLYSEKMLPRGEYLGELYDIGFDRPETHAIRKDG
ncbi:MAG: alpha-galactosidase, partial [Xanthomonadales bacterium]|nr:alpha-galactosidase [Xanthomonadales bacterium]